MARLLNTVILYIYFSKYYEDYSLKPRLGIFETFEPVFTILIRHEFG